MLKSSRLFATALAMLLPAACATQGPRVQPSPAVEAPADTTRQPPVVAESYVSASAPQDELDSLTTWPAPGGETWLIATAKAGHSLVVFDADSGLRLRDVGGKGSGPGQFLRPNGVAIMGDHLFVTERDNRRVQMFSLPGFTPLGSFGEAQLRSPYGVWINETAPGELDLYVTDSFMDGERFDVVPALEQLDQRVRRYRVAIAEDGRVSASYAGAFGDTSSEAALRMVESLAGDAANDRLLIADEDRRHVSTLREYTLAGQYTGRSLPGDSFATEAEGVALWSCGIDRGYWVAVDQSFPLSRFLVFDRGTLQPRGSFSGRVVARTDGIALHAAATSRFPAGALFAVHDDQAVAAFDLRDVIETLDLDRECLR